MDEKRKVKEKKRVNIKRRGIDEKKKGKEKK